MFWREARVVISAFLALTLVLQMALGAGAARAAESEEGAIEAIPPRLSYADGEVSYYRPGAQDWAPAQVNTALAPGDIIHSLNGAPVTSIVALRDSLEALKPGDPTVLQIERDGHLRYMNLELE